jgi:hypothetical protein
MEVSFSDDQLAKLAKYVAPVTKGEERNRRQKKTSIGT